MSDSSYLEKLKITFSGSFVFLFSCISLYIFSWWTKLFDFKVLTLIPKNRVLTWAKSIKSSSFSKDALRELNSFCWFCTVDFLWQFSSLNRFYWHYLYVEYFRWFFAILKFKNSVATLLSLNLHKNSRSNSVLP